MTQEYPSDTLDKYVLRFPDGMRDELKAAAKAAHRTMNAEMIARLAAPQRTLRDEFAMAALAGSNPDSPRYLAEWAYDVADAMIEARKK